MVSDDHKGHNQKRPRHSLCVFSEHLLCAQPHSGHHWGSETVADKPWTFPLYLQSNRGARFLHMPIKDNKWHT